MAEWPENTLFVVYCAGPHCNGADQAALKLARLGRKVKLMIGGITGWADEGLELLTETADVGDGPAAAALVTMLWAASRPGRRRGGRSAQPDAPDGARPRA